MGHPNILVLTGFSKDSAVAVRAAVGFAGKYGAMMTVPWVIRDESQPSAVLSDAEVK